MTQAFLEYNVWLEHGQVLPSRMVVMAEPNPDSLLAALEEAVQRVHTVDPMLQHQQVMRCCATLGRIASAIRHFASVTLPSCSDCNPPPQSYHPGPPPLALGDKPPGAPTTESTPPPSYTLLVDMMSFIKLLSVGYRRLHSSVSNEAVCVCACRCTAFIIGPA